MSIASTRDRTGTVPQKQGPLRRGFVSRLGRFFYPLEPISPRLYRRVGVLVIVLGLGLWAGVSYGGLVNPTFVPTPTAIVDSIVELYQQGILFRDILASLTVVMTGFVLAALVSIPLGVLMGTFRMVEAIIEPWVGFIRYLPVVALIPLFIVFVGIGTMSRISVIFYGTFFQLVLMVADVTSNTKKELVESAYTLGISRRAALTKVLLPSSLPGIVDNLRITLGWAWTYLVVAEIMAANKGLGYLIIQSLRGFRVDQIWTGILLIGFLGMIFDRMFRLIHDRFFPWSERSN